MKLDWNDDALRDEFYKGLKDVIKDDLKRNRPITLNSMISEAVKIDNANYKR